MDRFIHNIRLGLERLLYKDEKDLLSEEIQKYSKDVFNDYDIIKMIVSIFSNKYAELSEEEAELAEIEDVPEVGEARANWNRARGKALLAKQLLNGIALDENKPDELNLILLTDVFNGMAHSLQEKRVKELYDLKHETMKKMLEIFPKGNIHIEEASKKNADLVVYFRFLINNEPTFVTWHSKEGIVEKPLLFYNYLMKKELAGKCLELVSEDMKEKLKANIQNGKFIPDKWFGIFDNPNLIETMLNESYRHDLDFSSIPSNRVENQIVNLEEQNKELEKPKRKKKDEKLPRKLSDVKKQVLDIFSGIIEDDIQDYDFSEIYEIKEISDNVKDLLNSVSDRTVNDELVRTITLASIVGELIKDKTFNSPELEEIYNKLISNLECTGTKLESTGRGRHIHKLVICMDNEGKVRKDRYLYFEGEKWKGVVDYSFNKASEKLKYVKLDLYTDSKQARDMWGEKAEIERIPFLELEELQDLFGTDILNKGEVTTVYEGNGSYADVEPDKLVVDNPKIMEGDKELSVKDPIEKETLVADKFAEEIIADRSTVGTDDIKASADEIKKPAGDVDKYLSDEEVQRRLKEILINMPGEEKIGIMKDIVSALTPEERFKFLGELLQEFNPANPSTQPPSPPRKRGRPKGSKNKNRNGGMTK